MELKFHGENGITFAFFSEANRPRYLKHFITKIEPREKIRDVVIEEIHFFPSFGRGGRTPGFGEPDFLIVFDNFFMLFELEFKKMNSITWRGFEKKYYKESVYYQLERFYSIGEIIIARNRELGLDEKLHGEFIMTKEKERYLKGKAKIRNLINKLVHKQDFHVVAVTRDDQFPNNYKEFIKSCKEVYPSLKESRFKWTNYQAIREVAQKFNFKNTLSSLKLNNV